MKLSTSVLSPLCVRALLALASAGGCAPAATTAPPQAPVAEAQPAPQDSPEEPKPKPSRGSHLIDFLAIGRGDRVADLGDGRGYSIARIVDAVGPFGTVYVRHDPRTLHALASESRADAPEQSVPANVIRMITPIEQPFAPEATKLDCVTLMFYYQELVADRREPRGFHAAVFRALKPGGLYVVADHAPVPGALPSNTRVAADAVRADVESVGFRFVEAVDFASEGAPPRAEARPSETSQYALKFQKPR